MAYLNLQAILAPISLNKFFSEYWGYKFLYLTGEDEKFSNYFTWNDLNKILSSHRLEPPRLRLEQAGKSKEELSNFIEYVHARRGHAIPYINVPIFNQILSDGATLVLDAVDELHSNIRTTCENMCSTFYVNPQVNLYASWGDSEGFGLHWDDHDVFVLHLYGTKKWQFFGASREYPLYRDVSEGDVPTWNPIFETNLTPGDILYIPRGHWHNVVGYGAHTMHLTIGITTPTGIDLINWLCDELRTESYFRKDLPIHSNENTKNTHMKNLNRLICDKFNDNILEKFLESRKIGLRPRTYTSLPYSCTSEVILPDNNFQFRFTGVLHGEIKEDIDNESIIVNCIGKTIEFSINAGDLMRTILKGDVLEFRHVINEFGGVMGEEEISELISNLLEINLIYILPE